MRRSIRYAALDPTGNITLLVRTAVPPALQPACAARLMTLEPASEQVGFLSDGTDTDIALRMAGGEFCGNAAMSAAVLFADASGAGSKRLQVAVSGIRSPVEAETKLLPDGDWLGTVSMPAPISVRREVLPDGSERPVIRFDGITHVIMDGTPDPDYAESLAPFWCRALDAQALGLLFLDVKNGTMSPLVYVPGAGTLCWENSCASGTTAVGAFLAAEGRGSVRVSLRQPGGILTAEADADGRITLQGKVRILGERASEIEL